MDDEPAEVECRRCRGTGVVNIPVEDDWGEVECFVERTCDPCGGTGKVDPEWLAEMRACYGPDW